VPPLALRLGAVLLLVVAAVGASFAMIISAGIDSERRQQLADARSHFEQRIEKLEDDWRNSAFGVARLIELWQSGMDAVPAATRNARLRTLLLTVLDQTDFTHATISDGGGTVLFRFGTRSQDVPQAAASAPGPAAWAWSAGDRIVYRVVDGGAMRLGATPARLTLYAPLDNALLSRLVYPSTGLAVLGHGETVAVTRSRASEPLAGMPHRAELELRWNPAADAPLLAISRGFKSPLSPLQLLLALAAASALLVSASWLVLGRWVQSQTDRLRVLQQAAADFAALGVATSVPQEVQQRLKAVAAAPDDIGRLADNLGALMQRTTRHHAEQAMAREGLAQMNTRLEERVSERTGQLAAANDALAQRADQAEAATRAKSAFLANMSHEIRTPMNAILGLSHLMARDSRDPLQRDRLTKVDVAARHLLQVLNDILDLSKIEAGKVVLEEVDFALDELLSRVFEIVGGAARAKGLELVLDTDHLPARLRGDPTRLSQALLNLLGNAVKFTHTGWVRLGGELVAEDARGVRVRFTVQDTGEGIAAERQGQLFQPFEQADTSATRRYGGTGLGLALTRHLAALMGGEVGLQSTPGIGSSFWFTARLAHASEAGDLAASVALAGLRALVVDDLPEALAALAERLHLLGLHVDALDGTRGVLAHVQAELAAGRAYDVVLVDWRMPPPDGIEILRQLRTVMGEGMPPAILVTAFDEPLMWRQARGVQCDAVIVKPITASALHDTLVRVLRQSAGAGPVAAPLPGNAEALLRQRHGGQRVLLAEDNEINRLVGSELLRSAGLIVETADNGLRAVELSTTRHYDLVLLDVQMPVMDGLEAARRIRARLGRALPMLALTANAFSEDRKACLEAGMNDHVGKPVDAETLYTALLRWLPLPQENPEVATPSPLAATPAARDSAALLARLDGVGGLELAEVRRLFDGQLPLLERLLRKFVELYAQGEPAFLQSGADGPPANWRAVSHALSGACSSIGCTALAAMLRDFEQRLGQQAFSDGDADELAAQARKLHGELLRVVTALNAALQD
jgi:signal transduction histidine kinase/DNA-binding response OmpR family regulator/HPt (histidine-containing phosphotransfer) domain-containing protein